MLMIDEILNKAKQGNELTDNEYLELLNNQDKEYLEKADKDKVQYYKNVKALKKTTRICR